MDDIMRERKIFEKQVKIRLPLYKNILKEIAPKINVTLEFEHDGEAWSRHETKNKSTIHVGSGICIEFIKGVNKKVTTASMRWALDEMFAHEFLHTLVTEAYTCTWERTYENAIKHYFHNAVCDPYIELFTKFNRSELSLYQRREARKLMKWSVKLTGPYFNLNHKYKDDDDFSSFMNYLMLTRTLNYKSHVSKKYSIKIKNKFYDTFPENKKFEEMFYNEHRGANRFKIIDDWFNWIRSTKYFDFSMIDFMELLIKILSQIFGSSSGKAEGFRQLINEEINSKKNDPDYNPLDKEGNREQNDGHNSYQPNKEELELYESDDEVLNSESSIAESLAELEAQDINDSQLDEELEDITYGREGYVITYDE